MVKLTHYLCYKVYQKAILSNDIKDVQNDINFIVKVYEIQNKRTKTEILKGEFKPVKIKGILIDWNTFYHDQNDKIRDLYFSLLSHYRDLQYKKNGFSIIDIK